MIAPTKYICQDDASDFVDVIGQPGYEILLRPGSSDPMGVCNFWIKLSPDDCRRLAADLLQRAGDDD